MMQLRQAGLQIALFNLVYAVALALFYLANPFLDLDLATQPLVQAVFYLPQAVLVLGAWLYRGWLPLYCLPMFLAWYLPFCPPEICTLVAMGVATAVAANEVGRRLAWQASGAAGLPARWTYLVGIGLGATTLNLVLAQGLFAFDAPVERLRISTTLLVSQVSGLVGGLVLLMLVFKAVCAVCRPRLEE